MDKLNKFWAISSLYQGLAYIIWMVFFIGIVNYNFAESPLEKLDILANFQTEMYIIMTIIYVIFGFSLAILSLVLFEKLKEKDDFLAKLSLIIWCFWAFAVIASGLIFNVWSALVVDIFRDNADLAVNSWIIIENISNAIWWWSEILWWVWMIILSTIMIKIKELKLISYLGFIVWISWILSDISAISEVMQGIFWLTQIVWFIWLSVIFFKNKI